MIPTVLRLPETNSEVILRVSMTDRSTAFDKYKCKPLMMASSKPKRM
jgi:hypothetical protein